MQTEADRARAIFQEASAYPGGAERAAFVAAACGEGAELRRWVEELLAVFDRAALAPGGAGAAEPGTAVWSLGGTPPPGPTVALGDAGPAGDPGDLARTLDSAPGPGGGLDETTGPASDEPVAPGGDQPTATFHPGAGPKPRRAPRPDRNLGRVIAGKYTLVAVIGEGGMGSVYLARQSEPVRREVALKLIKAGLDSRAVLARFEAERQALAVMEHPNIARVYDGGTTPGGMPFFAMELVRGDPITDYCDRHRLPPAARLELFAQVCRAVQHAHQKGIIHRDLKPGNILVTEVDGRPTPKVIDFGVAKATGPHLGEPGFSDAGAVVGTPTYMSPEQADPATADIDTRTDVYALGVVLYELLTGTPPLRASDFRRGAVLEMLRMVREAEPPHPSTRAGSDAALPSIAANRAMGPGQLLSLLRGDIDWVVMKAIDKDRERRYESANGLASDIARYLANETVAARPPTRRYRLRKFARRNRAAVAAGAAFALLLAGGAGGVVAQWREAVAQRAQAVAARAEAEANFAVALEQRMVALKALGQVLDIARKDLPNVPATQGVQRKVLGVAADGLRDIAENPLVRVSLKDTTLAAANASTARLHLQLGDTAKGVEDFRAAEAVYERILRDAPAGAERDTVAQNLALVKMALAQTSLRAETPAQARAHLDRALSLVGELGPGAPPDFRRNLATLYRMVGVVAGATDPREGRRAYGESLRISEELARDHPAPDKFESLFKSYVLVGSADFGLRDPASCEKLYRQALALAEGEASKPGAPPSWRHDLATARERLGDLLLRTGKTPAALEQYRLALGLFGPLSAADPKNVEAGADHSRILYSLGLAETRAGDRAGAAAHFGQSLDIREARVRDKPEGVALKDLMVSLARGGRTPEAVATAEGVLAKFGQDPGSLVDVACCLALASADPPADALAARAVSALARAVELGYRDAVNLETEPDLDALRARPDFRALLKRLAEGAK